VACFSDLRSRRARGRACRLAAAVIAIAMGSCRPSADIRPGDIRSYRAPRPGPAAADQRAQGRFQAGQLPPGQAPASQRPTPLRYELPEGWVDVGASGMRLATIRTAAATGDAAEVGEITIIPASGTLESNAARWQEQLTPQADPEKVARAIAAAEKVDVDGVESSILLLLDDAAENRQAILAAVIPVDEASSLFVKFKGAADLAHRLREPFTTFVRSIRWK
jgi:hypothetical protein